MAWSKFWGNTAAEVGAFVNDKPAIYPAVAKLIIQLEFEEKKGKSLPKDVLNAIQQLRSQLRTSLDQFDREHKAGIRALNYPRRVRDLADECRSAIYSWEPTLMAQSGILNKLKAYINAFIAEYFGVESCYSVEKNTLGLKQEMSTVFDETKDELTHEAIKGPEDLPCGFILS